MKKQNTNFLAVFENFKIRRIYDEKTAMWYFSVIDVIAALTEQYDYQKARNYWKKLAQRLREEGSESVTKCHRLKLEASDGKKYLTDVANAETLLRLIQSVPSKKGGKIAKDARKALEQKTGKSVITGENFLPLSKPKKVLSKRK